MPRGDRTGPAGMGPMTGRRMGFCGAGFGRGYGRGAGFGRGLGYGRGYGRGFGWMGYNPVVGSPAGSVDEKAVMADQVKFLEEELEIAKKQLENL